MSGSAGLVGQVSSPRHFTKTIREPNNMLWLSDKIEEMGFWIKDHQIELATCALIIYALYGLVSVVGGVNMRV